MLVFFVMLYLAITVVVGVWAARKVHSNTDFLLAGRQLPLYMATTVVFATWFGSETLLGASSEFAAKGVLGIIEDPFGAALCLFLVGLFFARKLYRLRLLTFGDFYRHRYNRTAETVAAFFLVISYFGWIAAQLVALGLIGQLLFGTSLGVGIGVGSVVVVSYTFLGGMWSVSVTDFVQTILIIAGLLVVTALVVGQTPLRQVTAALPPDFFAFTPTSGGPTAWVNYLALWITIGLGSIPQQDVFQRVMASRSERVAVWSSVLAGLLYLSVALLPLVLALYARARYPELMQQDTQLLVPTLVLRSGSLLLQVLFFGSLISAIMSTASGAVLAPAAILSKNVLRPLLRNPTDERMLAVSRASVLVVAAVSLGLALLKSNIYELVSESSALSLVSLFVPLVAGLYSSRVGSTAAVWSMLLGMGVWLGALSMDTTINPLVYGLAGSVAGILPGFLWPPSSRRSLASLASAPSSENSEPPVVY